MSLPIDRRFLRPPLIALMGGIVDREDHAACGSACSICVRAWRNMWRPWGWS